MTSKKTLKQIISEQDKCFLVPCVYDCASNRAVEMCGFPVSLLSGGEVSISMNGMPDYGFTNLTDLEWVVSRVATTSSMPLICDIEDGFGGPLAVYRSAKRLAAAGAAAVQLEDAGDMEESTNILPRDKYLAKVRAALAGLKGTNCLLIARTNADPDIPAELKEGNERLKAAMDLGADLAMFVKITKYEQAVEMAKVVTGWKIFADVRGDNGVPAVTMDQLTELGFVMCSTHYTMKAAMEGMLEHGIQNFKNQSVAYTFTHASGTGKPDFSASPLFEPQQYLELENSFTGQNKEYTIVGHHVDDYPEGFKHVDIEERF
ncbi:isocitrate lyase/PEP mutase family protein [Secundilactobacillus mixtipabuli]|uniref:Carboxyvinyl-carboxyphosphonate phosphorylmutase n=2 Tax=Secundilactobacillus mixtipabuli TaxID=1435342 RepID=A0A1Z5IA56_9LACO|nr:isocitrate lyase/PEP mutase family protein [Secundilactobacillus mixtipabuli]GAW98508.1 carboxyvinyl-carboxyphosphonate phosphorylmutase [Secundilactobacillus mixtipabuli]GAW98510.1 carboxyvinyl-carboxyphosphonate phosphorylmutase [Secundilactobacillus mixtipabuli]